MTNVLVSDETISLREILPGSFNYKWHTLKNGSVVPDFLVDRVLLKDGKIKNDEVPEKEVEDKTEESKDVINHTKEELYALHKKGQVDLIKSYGEKPARFEKDRVKQLLRLQKK